MESTHFDTGEAKEAVRFQGVSPVSRLVNTDLPYSELLNPQGTFPTPLSRSGRAPLENPDLKCPQVTSPAPSYERNFTKADLESKRNFLPGVSSLSSHTRTELQSNRGLPHANSCGQASQCSSMSHQKRNHSNSFAANRGQQSPHFNVEQQCPHVSSINVDHRDHIDSCSANFEQMTYSNEFPAGLEQRNHVNSFRANPEQSIHVNSSASSCCQPSKHHGRHGEPLYKSLSRPHHHSQSPLMDYVDGQHHLLHNECSFEAGNSQVGIRHPHQCIDCISCRFGFSNLDANNISRGSVSNGQSYYTSKALLNEITLYNWYLIRSSGSHSSEIAVGGFLSNRGIENERIETSTIVKRLEDCKVLTKDGNVVNLMGPIDDYRTVSNGFSLQTVHLFISGFPHIWNLVVGMGLPAKGVAGTNTTPRSCDFYGGEVTSQVSLQKDIQIQGKCMHQSSAPECEVIERTSCLDVERPHGFKFVTEKGSQDVEAVAKVPGSVVMQELEQQGNTLLTAKPQVSKDQLPSIAPLHEEQLKCKNLVGADSDKETELLMDCKSDKETGLLRDCKTEHEASHGQMECTAEQLTESMSPTCEIENMPIESVGIAVTESRSEDKDGGSVTKVPTIQDNTPEEQGKKAFVEAKADANKPLDLHDNVKTVTLSDELDLTSVQSPEEIDGRESRMAKTTKQSHCSLSRKRKVIFNIQDDAENKAQSCLSLDPDTSTKNLGKPHGLNSNGIEHVPSTKSMDGEKSIVTKTVTAKQKGKWKKKTKFLLPKYKRSTKPMLTESTSPICEIENIPIESVEIAMTESRSEDKDGNFVTKVPTIQDNTLEEKHGKKAYVEAKADANKPLDLHNNAETAALSDGLDLSSVQSSEEIDCRRESRMAKTTKQSHCSLPRKRKVNFSVQDDVENKAQSCTSLDPDTSSKNLGKSRSLNINGAEHVPSAKRMDGEKSLVTKTVTAKQKGKRKKKARFLRPKYKQSSNPKVKVDTTEDTKDSEGAREVCNDKVLEAGCKRQKCTTRNRNQTDGQNGVILSPTSSPKNQTAEGKASITASVLEPILNRRVETRQGDKQKFYIKKAALKKTIAKKRRGCLANLQHTLNEVRVYNVSSQTEKKGQVSSMIDTQKVENKINDNLAVGSRRRKSGEGDSDLRASTSKSRRGKQILPPPLPLPLVSVSKQLVSEAFGLKTSRSGRLLVPPLAHWRGQSLVRDMDGGIIAIKDGLEDAPREDTGRFTFKPPMEARAKKLQKWLCDTATECLTKKLKARKTASSHKKKCIST